MGQAKLRGSKEEREKQANLPATYLVLTKKGYAVHICSRVHLRKAFSAILVFNPEKTEEIAALGNDGANKKLLDRIDKMMFERIPETAFFQRKNAINSLIF